MKIADAMHELTTKPVISLWPTAAAILGCSRSEIYAMAARGEIEVLPVGRLRKVITAPLRRKLKRESDAA
jgi:excisionase family DNA binding protein